MTTLVLGAFKRTLESSQSELQRSTRSHESLVIEASPDELDRIQHIAEGDYALGNLERNAARLRSVRTALDRIAAGTFGVCVVCEEGIDPKRLLAVPGVSSCIDCQYAADRGLKPFARLDG